MKKFINLDNSLRVPTFSLLLLMGMTTAKAQVCPSSSSPSDDANAYIENVSIGDINNTSVSCPSSYTSFTAMTTEVIQGQKYDLTLIVGSCGGIVTQSVRVYIDWNADNKFDGLGEEVAVSPSINGNGIYKTSIAIPPTLAEDKDIIMRVVTAEGNHPGACADYVNGETEDYTLSVKYISQIKDGSGDNRARDIGGGCYQLTPRINYVRGAAWFKEQLDLTEPFDIRMELYFDSIWAWPGGNGNYPEAGGGADGIAFVLQQQGLNAGTTGGGIGYQGLTNSLAVEFDPYYNFTQDPLYDHVAISFNGNTSHANTNLNPNANWSGEIGNNYRAGNVNEIGGINNTDLLAPMLTDQDYAPGVHSGTYYPTRLTWDPVTLTFEVWFNCEKKISMTGDLVAEIFRNDPNVYYGFTSSTGSEHSEHIVCNRFNSVVNGMVDKTICEDGIAPLNAFLVGVDPALQSFQWSVFEGDDISSLDDPTSGNPNASPTDTTIYIVEITIQDCYPRDPIYDTVTVFVIENTLVVLPDIPLSLCPGDDPVNLFEYLTPVPTTDGVWRGGQLSDGYLGKFDPSVAPTGRYSYKIGPTECDGYLYTVVVSNPPEPTLSILGGGEICGDGQDSTEVSFDLTGDTPWKFVYAVNGIEQPMIDNITSTPYSLKTARLGVYTPAFVATGSCVGTVDDSEAEVTYLENLIVSNDTMICGDTNEDFVLTFEIEGRDPSIYAITSIGTNNVTGSVSPTSPYIFTSDPIQERTSYHLVISDTNSCNPIEVAGRKSCLCPAEAKLNGGDIICAGEEFPVVKIDLTGTPPWRLVYSIDGNDTIVDNILTSPYLITPPDSGSHDYGIVDFQDAICIGTFSGVAKVVINPQPDLILTPPAPICGVVDITQPAVTAGSIDVDLLTYFTSLPDAEADVNGISGNAITVSGTYYIKGSTNSFPSCTDIEPIDIQYIVQPDLTITNPPGVCSPGTVDISLPEVTLGSKGGGDYTYFPTQPDADQETNPLADETYLDASGTYYIRATNPDRPECFDIAPVEVLIHNLPTLVITNPDSVCFPNVVDISTNATTAGSDHLGDLFYYSNDLDAILGKNEITSPDSITKSGTYYIKTVVGTEPFTCEDLAPVMVTIVPLPLAPAVKSQNICEGESTELIIETGSDTYDWYELETGGTPIASDAMTYTTPVLKAGAIYFIEATNSFGCVSEKRSRTLVYVKPAPIVSFYADPVCQGYNLLLANQTFGWGGDISYEWSFGNPNDPAATSDDNSPFYNYGDTSGRFTVQLKAWTIEGCIDSVSQEVIVNRIPIADFTADSVCIGVETTISAIDDPLSTIVSHSWTIWWENPMTGSELKHTFDTPGKHLMTLGVTSDNGCYSWTRGDVIVHPKPKAEYTVSPQPADIWDTNITFHDLSTGSVDTDLTVGGWRFGDGDSLDYTKFDHPIHPYSDENISPFALYNTSLTVQNQFGCIDNYSLPVRIDPISSFYVPNAFSPNGDGINDGFKGEGYGILELDMKIFNRWGDLIFETQDPTAVWDGYDHIYAKSGNKTGPLQKVDTYVYKITVKNIFLETEVYRGEINLIK